VVHELPDAGRFFEEATRALKSGGRLLLSEPTGHVSESAFAATVEKAVRAGLRAAGRPVIRRERSVEFVKD
jgi:hypothetical protein